MLSIVFTSTWTPFIREACMATQRACIRHRTSKVNNGQLVFRGPTALFPHRSSRLVLDLSRMDKIVGQLYNWLFSLVFGFVHQSPAFIHSNMWEIFERYLSLLCVMRTSRIICLNPHLRCMPQHKLRSLSATKLKRWRPQQWPGPAGYICSPVGKCWNMDVKAGKQTVESTK